MKLLRSFFIMTLIIFCCGGSLHAQTAVAPTGTGTSTNPYQIATLNNLYWIAVQTNSGAAGSAVFTGSYFKQTADIDASATSSWFSGAGWTPIGYLDGGTWVDFGGTYDGQNHTISNLSINRPTMDEVGLFGGNYGGSVSNLGIVNMSVIGNIHVGAFGYVYGGCTITNCYSSGSVTAVTTYAGGLIGIDDETLGVNSFSQCHSSCSVSGTNNIGGLIGFSLGNASRTISNCYATGSVTASGTDVNGIAGGLIGYSDLGGTINNCYASGSITSTNGYAGGFICTNWSTINNCFATGPVTGKTYLGGFISASGGVLTNCYSSGNVTAVTSGGNYIGGFSGANTGTMSFCYTSGSIVCNVPITSLGGFTGTNGGTINANCFWNTASYPIGYGNNNAAFSAVGKTETELKTQATYTAASWDFSTIWGFNTAKNNQYPYLAWQTVYLPTVTTSSITTYNAYSATMGGNVTADGGPTVTERGVVYSTGYTDPSIGQIGTIQDANGSGTGAYNKSIGSLSVNKYYYVRAYATNSMGISYGAMQWFMTPNAALTFSDGSGFTQSVTPNSTDQVLGRFQLTADGSGSTFTAAGIKLNGTRTGLSNFKLWSSTNATFESGSDTQIGSTVAADPGDGNSITFSSFSSAVSTSGIYYFLTADVAAAATGTVQGVLVNNSSITLNSGALTGTITNAVLSNGTSPLPVELVSFTAKASSLNTTLTWKTATEINNYGFEVERRIVDNQNLSLPSPNRGGLGWGSIGFVAGSGTSNTEHTYSYSDANISSGTYAYRLKQIDNSGTFKYSNEAEVTISVPKVLTLANYPNPFNPTTTLSFTLAQDGFTTLKIYNVLGKEVATLVNGEMKAGITNTVAFDASKLASGVYFSRLENNGSAQIKKLVLMK
jgi:hypothetical protein